MGETSSAVTLILDPSLQNCEKILPTGLWHFVMATLETNTDVHGNRLMGPRVGRLVQEGEGIVKYKLAVTK